MYEPTQLPLEDWHSQECTPTLTFDLLTSNTEIDPDSETRILRHQIESNDPWARRTFAKKFVEIRS